jgi:apoptosis-inducing factor 3
MAQEETKLTGPDLSQGIAFDELPDGGMLVGHAGDEQILLVRRGRELFAVGAQCTHYQGPLAEGLLVGDSQAYRSHQIRRAWLRRKGRDDYLRV